MRDELNEGARHARILHNAPFDRYREPACPPTARSCARSSSPRARRCLTGWSAPTSCSRCCACGWSAGAKPASARTGRSRASSTRCQRCTAGRKPPRGRRSLRKATTATRRIGLPVVDKTTGLLRFHVWYPGCPMEEDAYGIPKPKDTDAFEPQVLLVPCVGFGPEGLRLGYGGGFYRPHARRAEAAALHGGPRLRARLLAVAEARAARRAARRHPHRRGRDVGSRPGVKMHQRPSRSQIASVASAWFIV